MQQYMLDTQQFVDDKVYLSKDDLHHIYNVMRMKIGDNIVCVNTLLQKKYLCKIISLDGDIEILNELKEDCELSQNLVLVFGLVKADKLEFVIQKACELGVKKFIPLICQHSIVNIDDKKIEKKMIRWQKIIKEACEQSKRSLLMEIINPIKSDDLSKHLQGINLVAYENADINDKIKVRYKAGSDCLVIIGPEGGFSVDEITKFEQMNIEAVSLGKRILRCETAAISAVSIISDMME